MKNIIAGKTVLITGGTGSIGSEIAKQILSEKAENVIIFSRDEIKQFSIRNKIADTRLHTIVGDIRDIRTIEPIFNKYDVDIIYHAAAMKHVVMCEEFPMEAVKTNILGTQNIIDLAVKYGTPKMITITTDKAVYPVNVMGASKFISERITLNANTTSKTNQKFACVRFGNVANSRGSVIPILIENLINRKTLLISELDVTRFLMEIPDAVNLIIKATEFVQGGEIFILKMRAFKLGDLHDVMLNRIVPMLGMKKEDIEVNISGLVTGEKLHESLISDSEYSRLYKIDDMFVILPDHSSTDKYSEIGKVELHSYKSVDVKLISALELEKIVLKYLKCHQFPLLKMAKITES